VTTVHFSSKTHEWTTPQALFDALDEEFHFTIDVCASRENAKCERFLTATDDALTVPWTGVCWMNPPYGRSIGKWLRKAHDEAKAGATVVCLIPARTETAWWHDFVPKAHEVRFIRGRLRFSGMAVNAPFPSAIVVFKPPMKIPVWRVA
jgi:phage N-6-adenine-methyltransferase